MKLAWIRVAALAMVAAAAAAQDADFEAKEGKEEKQRKKFKFVFKQHPSFRFGNWLRLDFRARLQGDWTFIDPETKKFPQLFAWQRERIAVEGILFKKLEFEVGYEFVPTADFHWKDVYANYIWKKSMQFQGGRFRIPFSLEHNTGPTNLDFVDRSRIAARLANGRDTGGMVHGTVKKRLIRYWGGVFAHDGDVAADASNFRTGEVTVAGRLNGRPLELFSKAPSAMKEITIGGSATFCNVPEGLYSLRGKTADSDTFFTNYFVNGRRQRTGAEFLWRPGPFSVKSEYIAVREERKKQGLRGEDLPDLIGRGWYGSIGWMVTGQHVTEVEKLSRRHYIPLKQGIGAVEIVTRFEQLRFGSDTSIGRPSRSIRAANITPNSDRIWTFGVNWFVTHYAKLQANFMHDHIEDVFRAPVSGVQNYWFYKFRLQLVL